MSQKFELSEELTAEEALIIDSRTQETAEQAEKYQDFNKRLSKVLSLLKENKNFMQALEDDTFLQEKSPEKVMMFFRRECDPSTNGQFTQWVCEKYAKKCFRVEDFARVKDALRVYQNRRTDLAIQNLNQYRDLAQLEDEIDKLQSPDEIKESKRAQKRKVKNEGSYQIAEGENGGVVIGLKSSDAATFYAAGTKWCTSSPRMFEHYHKTDEIYVFITPSTRKYQLHEQSGQFMDDADRSIYQALVDYVKKSDKEKEKVELRDDYEFIFKMLPKAFCKKTMQQVGLKSEAMTPSVESENPKEQEEALMVIKELSPESLLALAKSHRAGLSLKACHHPNANDEVFLAAFSVDKGAQEHSFFKDALRSDKATDKVIAEAVKTLASRSQGPIALECARLPAAGTKTVIAAYMSGNLELMDFACGHDLAPAKMLTDALDKHMSSESIVRRVLSNKNTPYERIEPFWSHESSQFYTAALKNPQTPTNVLERAVKGRWSPTVMRIAALHENATENIIYTAFDRGDSTLKVEIAQRDTNPDSIRNACIKELNPEVRKAFAGSKAALAEELVYMFGNSTEAYVQSACLSNERFPVDQLKHFIVNGTKRSLKPVAVQNKALDQEFLLQQANGHKESLVRLEARKYFLINGGSEEQLQKAQRQRRIYI